MNVFGVGLPPNKQVQVVIERADGLVMNFGGPTLTNTYGRFIVSGGSIASTGVNRVLVYDSENSEILGSCPLRGWAY